MNVGFENISVYLSPEGDKYSAELLCSRIGKEPLPQLSAYSDNPCLCFGEDGVSLRCGELALKADFTKLLPRIKPSNLKTEMPVRACKIKNNSVGLKLVDATAGLGEDSFLLAASGFEVMLFEYDPVIAALLRDALSRALNIPEIADIARRMTFIEGDSIKAMQSLDFTPDVIYLDPMFPERQKSGLVKKKFQLLHCLECPCSTEEDLLNAALRARPVKTVIKRPARGKALAGVKPSYSLTGKSVRYDVIYTANRDI